MPPSGGEERFSQLAPRHRHGIFRVQPLLAAGTDIPPRPLLHDKVDLRDFLRGELSRAYECVDPRHRLPKVAREGPLF
jgi:hypothetical protein